MSEVNNIPPYLIKSSTIEEVWSFRCLNDHTEVDNMMLVQKNYLQILYFLVTDI